MKKRRSQRRAKSTIARLPDAVRVRIEQLLKEDRHTLDELIGVLRAEFPTEQQLPSRSALGRYSQRFEEIGARMRESREVAKVWVDRLGSEPQGDIAKLVMELLRTLAFDATLELQDARDEEGKPTLDPKAISTLALSMQRLEAASKWNLEREKQMREAIAEEVTTKLQAGPRKLDAEAYEFIRRAIRGES